LLLLRVRICAYRILNRASINASSATINQRPETTSQLRSTSIRFRITVRTSRHSLPRINLRQKLIDQVSLARYALPAHTQIMMADNTPPKSFPPQSLPSWLQLLPKHITNFCGWTGVAKPSIILEKALFLSVACEDWVRSYRHKFLDSLEHDRIFASLTWNYCSRA
jgi:hypothetical protein